MKIRDKNGLPLYNGDRVKYRYKRQDGSSGFIDCELFIKKKIATLKAGYTTVLSYDTYKNNLSEDLELIGFAAKVRSFTQTIKKYLDLGD